MASEGNEAVIRRFYEEIWNRGNLDVADELVADESTVHPGPPGVSLMPGPAYHKMVAGGFRQAFPDIHFTITVLVSDADHVVARWLAEGTQEGEWMGVAPSGVRIKDYTGVNIFRLSEGKIVEIWNNRDDLGLALQLGAVPPLQPPQPPTE